MRWEHQLGDGRWEHQLGDGRWEHQLGDGRWEHQLGDGRWDYCYVKQVNDWNVIICLCRISGHISSMSCSSSDVVTGHFVNSLIQVSKCGQKETC